MTWALAYWLCPGPTASNIRLTLHEGVPSDESIVNRSEQEPDPKCIRPGCSCCIAEGSIEVNPASNTAQVNELLLMEAMYFTRCTESAER